MRLDIAIANYTAYRRALGVRFRSQGDWLKSFCRAIGGETELTGILPEQVNRFINGTGPITSAWHVKYKVLTGLYHYAITRGLVATSPLPTVKPQLTKSFVPYIYTHEELSRLLVASLIYQKKYHYCLDPHTIQTLLLLLYGAGLRVSEGLSLRLVDVDLAQAVLTVRDSKFFTSRLVPIGSQLNEKLKQYAALHQLTGAAQNDTAPFFVRLDGQRIKVRNMEAAFRRIRKKAGISRTDDSSYQPRLHDLRHTFAVHRLISWYREGKDVQKLLPQLSVYLGHRCLAHTSVYLTMTPELLTEASQLFEQYALKGGIQ
jgi:integrase/recombinase XerD